MSEIEHWHFDVCPDCGAPPFQHGLDAPWFCTHPRDRYVPIKVVAASHLEGAVAAARADERQRIVERLLHAANLLDADEVSRTATMLEKAAMILDRLGGR